MCADRDPQQEEQEQRYDQQIRTDAVARRESRRG